MPVGETPILIAPPTFYVKLIEPDNEYIIVNPPFAGVVVVIQTEPSPPAPMSVAFCSVNIIH